uniref:Calmodulin binding protein C-terminal domain-containing protein n=1 Tax=Oryza brachyantha TaxID=4533 RepID=J3NA28_ORYBR
MLESVILEGNCNLKSYRVEEQNGVVIFFNCVHDLVGAEFRGFYGSKDSFEVCVDTSILLQTQTLVYVTPALSLRGGSGGDACDRGARPTCCCLAVARAGCRKPCDCDDGGGGAPFSLHLGIKAYGGAVEWPDLASPRSANGDGGRRRAG